MAIQAGESERDRLSSGCDSWNGLELGFQSSREARHRQQAHRSVDEHVVLRWACGYGQLSRGVSVMPIPMRPKQSNGAVSMRGWVVLGLLMASGCGTAKLATGYQPRPLGANDT